MLKYLSAVFGGLMFLAVISLIGCSSTDTKPTDTKPTAVGASSFPASSQMKSNPEVRKAQAAIPASGSLEAFRRGEAPTTPSESPLKEIYFDFDRYDLSVDARATLKANSDWLKKNPAVRLEVEGHCDERGTAEYNLALGAKRAQVAKDYLVNLGISAERISTISYGEEVPVCREQNEGCWQKNRRDRFVAFSPKPGV